MRWTPPETARLQRWQSSDLRILKTLKIDLKAPVAFTLPKQLRDYVNHPVWALDNNVVGVSVALKVRSREKYHWHLNSSLLDDSVFCKAYRYESSVGHMVKVVKARTSAFCGVWAEQNAYRE